MKTNLDVCSWVSKSSWRGVDTHCKSFDGVNTKTITTMCPEPAVGGVGLGWGGIGVKVTYEQSFQEGCFLFVLLSLVRRKVPWHLTYIGNSLSLSVVGKMDFFCQSSYEISNKSFSRKLGSFGHNDEMIPSQVGYKNKNLVAATLEFLLVSFN